jgi:hypothetical protein
VTMKPAVTVTVGVTMRPAVMVTVTVGVTMRPTVTVTTRA